MEMQLLQKALNSVLPTPDFRESPACSKEFGAALRDTKIATCDNDSLVQALRYAMLLVGIRAANLPNQMEFDVLKQFIRRTYSGHTPAEIRLAFEKAVAGELELSTDDVKPYENFSCEYVSRIMRAYRKWASAQYRAAEPAKPEVKQIDVPAYSPIEFVEYFYQSYRTGTIDRMIFPESAFDRAKGLFGIEYSEEELKNFVLRAREAVLSGLNDRIRETDSNKRLGEYVALKSERDLLVKIDPLDSCNVSSVNRLAKLYALEAFFETQKKKGITSLKDL